MCVARVDRAGARLPPPSAHAHGAGLRRLTDEFSLGVNKFSSLSALPRRFSPALPQPPLALRFRYYRTRNSHEKRSDVIKDYPFILGYPPTPVLTLTRKNLLEEIKAA